MQEANANEPNLLKNSKEKNPNHKGGHHQNHDYIIDEPVVKLIKNDKEKNPNRKGGHQPNH